MKTNLTEAYNRLRELNLEMSTEQYILVGQIMYDLADTQFEKGIDVGERIFNKYKNKIDLEK